MRQIITLIACLLLAVGVRSQTNNPAPYCAGGFDGTSSLYIDSVGMMGNTFVTMQNGSGVPAYANRYTFFSNKQMNLLRGTSYTIRIKHVGDTAHFLAVYIDYNIDGDFTDVGEAIVHQVRTAQQTIAKDFQTTFTPPHSATLGITRMRVVLIQDHQYTASANGIATSCTDFIGGSLDWGEAEDYVIRMAARPTLTTLPATDISLNGAKIHGVVTWQGAMGPRFFYFGVGINTISPDNGGSASDTIYATLTGLQPYQTYSYAVGANVDNYSSGGATLTFSTAPASIAGSPGTHHSLYLIYPNPAARKITIQTPPGAQAPHHVIVYDGAGHVAGRFDVASDGSVLFEDLPVGFYGLAVWTEKGFAFRQNLLLQ
jgi:hypothetical protein